MATIYIGTSGWSYKHWIGTFYPAGIKESSQFEYYLKSFQTVELNNPFYHLPARETFVKWRKSTPENFIFSVKASRYITHMKKLLDGKETTSLFLKHAGGLKEKLGPILFQLPPGWKINVERLKDFLSHLPKKHRYVFEFRNSTWYDEKIYSLLRKYNCAFCIYELEHHFSPTPITADFVYVRLHGPEGKYAGSYTDTELKKWADQCVNWKKEEKDVFFYFDNDQLGYAAFNAIRLKELISE
jgi:uncharacterized protein YecE (DUF72 family)